jgi:hypothetical protein
MKLGKKGVACEYFLAEALNGLHYREGLVVFSPVTGGRPLSFSRRINGGSSSPEPVEGNAEPRFSEAGR